MRSHQVPPFVFGRWYSWSETLVGEGDIEQVLTEHQPRVRCCAVRGQGSIEQDQHALCPVQCVIQAHTNSITIKINTFFKRGKRKVLMGEECGPDYFWWKILRESLAEEVAPKLSFQMGTGTGWQQLHRSRGGRTWWVLRTVVSSTELENREWEGTIESWG